MRRGRFVTMLCAGLLAALPTTAQDADFGFAVGPQITSLGLGLSADVRLNRFSLSGGYSFVPAYDAEMDIDGIEYFAEPDIEGGTLVLNVHPFDTRFVLGVGVFFGGYEFPVVATPAEQVEFGDEVYQPEDVGDVTGVFTFGKTAPVLYVGWRGPGLNFGLGLTTTTESDAQLTAGGPIALSPEFQESLAEEEERIREEIKVLPVLPYFRIGWQFGQ